MTTASRSSRVADRVLLAALAVVIVTFGLSAPCAGATSYNWGTTVSGDYENSFWLPGGTAGTAIGSGDSIEINTAPGCTVTVQGNAFTQTFFDTVLLQNGAVLKMGDPGFSLTTQTLILNQRATIVLAGGGSINVTSALSVGPFGGFVIIENGRFSIYGIGTIGDALNLNVTGSGSAILNFVGSIAVGAGAAALAVLPHTGFAQATVRVQSTLTTGSGGSFGCPINVAEGSTVIFGTGVTLSPTANVFGAGTVAFDGCDVASGATLATSGELRGPFTPGAITTFDTFTAERHLPGLHGIDATVRTTGLFPLVLANVTCLDNAAFWLLGPNITIKTGVLAGEVRCFTSACFASLTGVVAPLKLFTIRGQLATTIVTTGVITTYGVLQLMNGVVTTGATNLGGAGTGGLSILELATIASNTIISPSLTSIKGPNSGQTVTFEMPRALQTFTSWAGTVSLVGPINSVFRVDVVSKNGGSVLQASNVAGTRVVFGAGSVDGAIATASNGVLNMTGVSWDGGALSMGGNTAVNLRSVTAAATAVTMSSPGPNLVTLTDSAIRAAFMFASTTTLVVLSNSTLPATATFFALSIQSGAFLTFYSVVSSVTVIVQSLLLSAPSGVVTSSTGNAISLSTTTTAVSFPPSQPAAPSTGILFDEVSVDTNGAPLVIQARSSGVPAQYIWLRGSFFTIEGVTVQYSAGVGGGVGTALTFQSVPLPGTPLTAFGSDRVSIGTAALATAYDFSSTPTPGSVTFATCVLGALGVRNSTLLPANVVIAPPLLCAACQVNAECTNAGSCAVNGTCLCSSGFGGRNCEVAPQPPAPPTPDPPTPPAPAATCNATVTCRNGGCVRGRCECRAGFYGAVCENVMTIQLIEPLSLRTGGGNVNVEITASSPITDAVLVLANGQRVNGVPVVAARDVLLTSVETESVGPVVSFTLPPHATTGYTPFTIFGNAGESGGFNVSVNGHFFYFDPTLAADCFVPGTWYDTVNQVCNTECPQGGLCPGDVRVWPVSGFWSFSELVRPVPCAITAACPGTAYYGSDVTAYPQSLLASGAVNTQVCSIADGYGGAFCADCVSGFYKQSQQCRFCGSTEDDRRELTGKIAAALILVSIMAIGVSALSEQRLTFVVQALLTIQQFVIVGAAAAGALNTRISDLFAYASVLNFDVAFYKPGCTVPIVSYVDVWWGTLVIVLIALVLFVFAAFIRARCIIDAGGTSGGSGGGSDDLSSSTPTSRPSSISTIENLDWTEHWKRRTTLSVVILGYIVYLQLATRVFQGLYCIDVNGESRLAVELSTLCYTGAHTPAAAVMWFVLAVFIIAFPIWCFVTVRRAHAKGASDAKRAQKYGYLYRGLRPRYYYYRVLSYAVNFGVALQLTLSTSVGVRVFVAGLFFVVYGVTAGLAIPFQDWYNNWAYCGLGFLLQAQSIVFLGFIDPDQTGNGRSVDRTVLLYILAAITAASLVAVIWRNLFRPAGCCRACSCCLTTPTGKSQTPAAEQEWECWDDCLAAPCADGSRQHPGGVEPPNLLKSTELASTAVVP